MTYKLDNPIDFVDHKLLQDIDFDQDDSYLVNIFSCVKAKEK
jgi:hypothetical protein